MGGLRVVGGVAARACVETKRKTHSSNGAATDLEASGTGREVNNPPSDRDSILIIDLAGTIQYLRLAARWLCLARFFVSLRVEALSRQRPGQRGMSPRILRIKFRRTAQLRQRFIDLSLIKQKLA